MKAPRRPANTWGMKVPAVPLALRAPADVEADPVVRAVRLASRRKPGKTPLVAIIQAIRDLRPVGRTKNWDDTKRARAFLKDYEAHLESLQNLNRYVRGRRTRLDGTDIEQLLAEFKGIVTSSHGAGNHATDPLLDRVVRQVARHRQVLERGRSDSLERRAALLAYGPRVGRDGTLADHDEDLGTAWSAKRAHEHRLADEKRAREGEASKVSRLARARSISRR